MAIYNECKIVINLNQLVKARPCGVDLADEHVDNIANDLRKSMTFDSLFGQVDQVIWDYADECNIDLSDSEECQSFGFQVPHYGETAGNEPAMSFEAEQKRIAKEKAKAKKEFEKNFEMVELDGGSWKIEVPQRKNK